MEKEKYYISTAIAYTSGKPHIGNTYEIILADAIARFKRLQGNDVYFQSCGTPSCACSSPGITFLAFPTCLCFRWYMFEHPIFK